MDVFDFVGGWWVVYGIVLVGVVWDGVGFFFFDFGRGRLDSIWIVVFVMIKLVGCEFDLFFGDGYIFLGICYFVFEGGGIFKEKG